MKKVDYDYMKESGPGGLEITATVLTIIFIIFKLCNIISWDWAFVFIPIWGLYMLQVIFFAALRLFIMIYMYYIDKNNRQE